MTTFERFEREIPSLMDELAPPNLPDYFDDMLRQTARTSQRPAWSALERWLPMGVLAQTRTIPRIPWRPLLVVAVPLDGGPTIAFGQPHPGMTNGFARAISPDGEQVLVSYLDDGRTWLFDVATAEGTPLDWSPAEGTAATWQRLAP